MNNLIKNKFFIVMDKLIFFVFLLLSFCSLTTQSVFSQEDTLNYEYEYDTIIVERKIRKLKLEEYKKGNLDFYLSPLGIFELCPTAYFGVEYFVENKISLYTDVGYIFSFRGERNVDNGVSFPYSSYPNYVIKPEIRFYTKNNPQKGSYHAIKFMFRNMNYKERQFVHDDYFYDEDLQRWTPVGSGYDSDYRVRRRSVGIQYIKGWKGRLGKTWINNFYFGVGMRYVANQPIDKRPIPNNDFWRSWNVGYLDLEQQYKFITIDGAVGFRIGTKLKKR